MAHRLQYRRDTKANWLKYNPVLMEGEVGYETDTHHQKVGDGVSKYSELEYEVGVGNITQEMGDSESLVMSQKAVTNELNTLESELNVIHFNGLGDKSVYRQVIGLLPNVTYRVYVKNKWISPVVPEKAGVFQLYYKKDDDTFQLLHNVTDTTDNLKDYYDVVLPEGKNLVIWAKIVEGETATFVIEKMDNTIKDITFQRNALNTYIVGKGTAYSGARFRAMAGRTYRISIPKKWNYPTDSTGAIFYIGKTTVGSEQQLLSITASTISELRDFYEIQVDESVDYINIGGRANEGENIYVIIEDITDSFNLNDSRISEFNTQDLEILGMHIPIKKQGYIAFAATNFNNPIFTFNYHYEIIPCKIGDIFFVKAKGGNEARLYMLYDQYFNMITYTEPNVDVSEIGTFFRCFVNGYFVVNTDIRKKYKVIKISDNIQNNLTPIFDIAKYIKWRAGGVRWTNGTTFESSINQMTGFMCTFNYNKIRLNVNVSITENPSTGIAFYDSERNYISGIQNIIGTEVSSSIQEYNIPENAHYFKTTCFNDYIEGFICELYNSTEKTSIVKDEESKIFNNYDLNWVAGYADFYTGEIKTSTVNSVAELNIENYANIELTVNKSASAASPGICFYDKDDNFIIGFPYPNFGDSTAISTYVTKIFSIPYNAVKVKISLYTRFLSYFKATIYKETARGYNAISKLSNFADSILDNIIIGSPKLFISEPTADTYTSLNGKTIDELYERWDSLVDRFPMYIRRGDNIGKVSDGTRDYVIRQYVIGYNGRYMVDHEPAKDEIVSSNHWRIKDNPRKILINNGMHGEEKTPCWGAMLAFEELLSSDADWANYIKSNFDLYIIPCQNPYGFHKCQRGNINGITLNRDNAINEPEHLAYMSWVESNKDAFALIDNHGTQGRYAYIPVWAGQPIFSAVNKIATQLSASLYNNYKQFYENIQQGYGETYSPFLLAKYSIEASYGRAAVEMLERFAMTACALETPDNIVVENSDGSVNESLSGIISQNDLRCCKITKDLLINFIQAFGKLSFNRTF